MCKWYQFHKWNPIKQQENGIFMGEKYSRLVDTEYRICAKCGLIQGFTYDSQGGQWLDEVQEFQDIIRKRTYRVGNDFILIKNKEVTND